MDEILVRPRAACQTMQGFGASGAWWAHHVGLWPDTDLERVLRLLFDARTGIGLSVYRYNIGAGGGEEIRDPWRRAETFLVRPGVYDWSRDAGGRRVLRAACALGVPNLIAFANSPPAALTISGLASGGPQGASNLAPDANRAYAQYLVDVLTRLRRVEGVPVGWISPINEPQWDWNPGKGQEGCHWEVDEGVALLREVVTSLSRAGLGVRVSAPECGDWKSCTPWLEALEAEPWAAGALPHLALHSYWSRREDRVAVADWMASRSRTLPLWMSEWCEMRPGRDMGMDSALVLAQTVHDDLVLGGVTSWQYWIGVSKYDYRDGLLYVDESSRAVLPTKRLWALGNFSRFVRPGAVRLEADCTHPEVRAMAFSEARGAHLVLVAINLAQQDIALGLRTYGKADLHPLEAWVTSEEHDLAAVAVGRGPVRLAGRSVTTVLLTAV